jgi:fluoroquinolone transport system ATP-binding protein
MVTHGKAQVKVGYEDNGSIKDAIFPIDNIGTNTHFRKLLDTKKILTMHSMEATLEDVFIKFTGRKLS